MKSLFFAFVFSFVLGACAFGGEELQSVMQPTPAIAPMSAPAVVAESVPACNNGTCCSESTCRSSCRDGLFGRTIERTRTVTRAVVAVPAQVIAAPVRVFRSARGCCRCCR